MLRFSPRLNKAHLVRWRSGATPPSAKQRRAAGLLRNYLHAYLLTGDANFCETANGIVDYSAGGSPALANNPFYGCQDYVRPQRGAEGPPGGRRLVSSIDELFYSDANAQAASALLEAWWLLGRDDCRRRATETLQWLWRNLRDPEGGICHIWHGAPEVPGLLGNAVFTGLAFLDAYAVLGGDAYLDRARLLADEVAGGWRNPDGGFHDVRGRGPDRLRLPATLLSLNAAAARLFAVLADRGGAEAYRDQVCHALAPFAGAHGDYGAFAAAFAQALSRLLLPPLTADIAGPPGDEALRQLARAATRDAGHADVVLRFSAADRAASLRLRLAGRTTPWIDRPEDVAAAAGVLLRA